MAILLPQSLEHWIYRHVQPHMAFIFVLVKTPSLSALLPKLTLKFQGQLLALLTLHRLVKSLKAPDRSGRGMGLII